MSSRWQTSFQPFPGQPPSNLDEPCGRSRVSYGADPPAALGSAPALDNPGTDCGTRGWPARVSTGEVPRTAKKQAENAYADVYSLPLEYRDLLTEAIREAESPVPRHRRHHRVRDVRGFRIRGI